MRKTLVLLLALLLLVIPLSVFVSCGSKAEITEEELKEKAAAASADVKSCWFSLSQTLHLTGEGKEKKIDTTAQYDITGAVDLENQKMRLRMLMKLPEEARPQGMPETFEMEQYCLGDAIYTHANLPGMPSQWLKSKAPEGYWEMQKQAQSEVELLQSSEFKILGREKVGGTECWLVELKPDMQKLAELASASPLAQLDAEHLRKTLKNVEVRQWYAVDTFLPLKGQFKLVMGGNSRDFGFPGEELNLTMTMDLTYNYSKFNEPVELELPPEAEKAVEMNIPQLEQKP